MQTLELHSWIDACDCLCTAKKYKALELNFHTELHNAQDSTEAKVLVNLLLHDITEQAKKLHSDVIRAWHSFNDYDCPMNKQPKHYRDQILDSIYEAASIFVKGKLNMAGWRTKFYIEKLFLAKFEDEPLTTSYLVSQLPEIAGLTTRFTDNPITNLHLKWDDFASDPFPRSLWTQPEAHMPESIPAEESREELQTTA